jgi:general secretion pathway protein D
VFEEQQGANTGGSQQPNTVKPNYDLKVGSTVLNEVGIKLVVTPRIAGRTNVFMDLKPEISAKGVDEVKVLGGKRNESPTFTRKRINTQAVVPTGHTLVLGGLVSDLKSKNFVKVPILGDMPVVGLAFRKESKLRDKKNLMIFVTPTIVQTDDYHAADRGRRFMRENRVVESTDREESAWDRGKPYDWNKGK